ncbi:ion transporter [Candidatus Fermentibacteria bacterium]|nr:ion transporter [Candidatus Fermentibacteria bacterium]
MPGSGRRLKRRLFEIIEAAHRGDRASRAFDLTIITLITLNIIAVILGSVNSINLAVGRYLRWFEVFSVSVLTVEYALRLWTSDLKTDRHDPVMGRLRYMVTPMALIDLAAILPFYLPWVVGLDLRFLRAVRLVRLLMLFKVNRYSSSLKLLGEVFKEKRGEIGVTFFIVLIMILMSSGLMYYVENSAQPDKYGSIPEAILWSIATITSADPAGVYPVTIAGRALGAIVALLGIGLFALPAGILASGFDDVLRRRRLQTAMSEGSRICPHCGRPLEPESSRNGEGAGGGQAVRR